MPYRIWVLCLWCFAAILTAILLAALARAQAMPDRKLTPGAISNLTAKQLCDPKFHTGTVRNVPLSEKKSVCRAYGVMSGCPGPAWELDHDCSIEIGGSNDAKNLWPQPIAEARRKDVLENRLHKEMCAGKITLLEAQQCIVQNWVQCYQKHIGAL
jgi:hypothetical protein